MGEVASAVIEHEADERKIDHVWLALRAGAFGRVQVALSTCSRQSRAAGFDPRLRVAQLMQPWTELPAPGLREAPPLDYRDFDAAQPLAYTPHERPVIEQMFVTRAHRAVCVQAWGEFYVRNHPGVHQIHSQRASLAVARDVIGRDGAIQFYYRNPDIRELLLLKFAGQP